MWAAQKLMVGGGGDRELLVNKYPAVDEIAGGESTGQECL